MKQVLKILGAVNLGGFLVSAAARSEVITDLLGTGGIGVSAYLLRQGGNYSPVIPAVMLWSARLSLFLAFRAATAGDARLRAMLPREGRGLDLPRLKKMAAFWSLQALWGLAMLAPAATMDDAAAADTGLTTSLSTLGAVAAASGLLVEIYADFKKLVLKRRGVDLVKFRLVQYPAYSGEILFWSGVALMTWEKVGLISILPVSFVSLLLLFVSGIPLSEKSRNRRLVTNVEVSKYRANTKWLIPFIY